MMCISEMKVSPNANKYEYLDSTVNSSLLHSVEPSISNLKEQLLAKSPRNVAEVKIYDDVLEDLSTRHTYTLT